MGFNVGETMDLGEAWPSSLWDDRGLPSDFPIEKAADDLLPIFDRRFGASRDIELVVDFCREMLPSGRIYVYGAGTHTRALLPELKRIVGLEILGIVDRLAAMIGEFDGVPVIAPDALPGRQFDYVLLSHTQYESEMHAQLMAFGIPAERVVAIYLNRSFCDFAARSLSRRLPRLKNRGVEHVIINCSRDSIISDAAISTVFEPARTISLFMGRPDAWQEGTIFEALDLHESLDLLCEALATLRPRTVYIRSVIYKNYFGLVIKKRFPEICVVHEMYDFALTWRDDDLEALFGLNGQSIGELRVAELYASQHMDCIVSKRGGPYWASVEERFKAPYELYFPLISDVASTEVPAVPEGDGRPRLLYGGFLPSPAFLTQFKNGYDFIGLMESVAARTGAEIDIYNSTHTAPDGDAIYKDYIDRFRDGPIRYHARVAFKQLVDQMPRYDFGWLCEHVKVFQPDRYFGVCNRWTGYLMGGLPTLVDGAWKFMADLTREYDAGIVVEDVSPEGLAMCLEKGKRINGRAGARALRGHLARQNQAVLDRMASIVERHGAR